MAGLSQMMHSMDQLESSPRMMAYRPCYQIHRNTDKRTDESASYCFLSDN